MRDINYSFIYGYSLLGLGGLLCVLALWLNGRSRTLARWAGLCLMALSLLFLADGCRFEKALQRRMDAVPG